MPVTSNGWLSSFTLNSASFGEVGVFLLAGLVLWLLRSLRLRSLQGVTLGLLAATALLFFAGMVRSGPAWRVYAPVLAGLCLVFGLLMDRRSAGLSRGTQGLPGAKAGLALVTGLAGLMIALATAAGLVESRAAGADLRSLRLALEIGAALAGLGAAAVIGWQALSWVPVSFVTRLVGVILVVFLLFFVPGGLGLLHVQELQRLEAQRRDSYLAYLSALEISGEGGTPASGRLDIPTAAGQPATTKLPASVGYLALVQEEAPLFLYIREGLFASSSFNEAALAKAILADSNAPVVNEAAAVWPRLPRFLNPAPASGRLDRPDFWAYRFQEDTLLVEVGFPAADERQAMQTQVLQLWGFGLAGVAFILFFFPLIFQATLLQPLQELVQGVQALKTGQLSTRIPVPPVEAVHELPLPEDISADELRQLAATFNEMAAALEAQTGALQDANRQLQLEMETRQRLARDLHDSVSQTLYGLALLASGLRADFSAADEAAGEAGEGAVHELEARLAELETEARNALEELRLLLYELRPLALEQDGLAGALERRLKVMEQRTGLQGRLVVNFSPGVNHRAIPSQAELDLYYLALEALNNVVKHAAAAHVEVILEVEPSGPGLHLVITDDGQGFDLAAAAGKGLGLESMQARASRLGGTLQIHTAPGQGTRVEFWGNLKF